MTPWRAIIPIYPSKSFHFTSSVKNRPKSFKPLSNSISIAIAFFSFPQALDICICQGVPGNQKQRRASLVNASCLVLV